MRTIRKRVLSTLMALLLLLGTLPALGTNVLAAEPVLTALTIHADGITYYNAAASGTMQLPAGITQVQIDYTLSDDSAEVQCGGVPLASGDWVSVSADDTLEITVGSERYTIVVRYDGVANVPYVLSARPDGTAEADGTKVYYQKGDHFCYDIYVTAEMGNIGSFQFTLSYETAWLALAGKSPVTVENGLIECRTDEAAGTVTVAGVFRSDAPLAMTGSAVKLASVAMEVTQAPPVGVEQVLETTLSDLVITPRGYDSNAGVLTAEAAVCRAVLYNRPAPRVSATNASGAGKADGKITGTDATMEYRRAGDSTWIDCPGSEITGLTKGNYEVRYKRTADGLPPSASTTVTVGEAASGGGGGGGGGSLAETVEIPIFGEEESVRVSASVSDSTAKPDIPEKTIRKVIDPAVKTGTVTMDLTGVKQDITSVIIPNAALQLISDAANDSRNDTTALEIRMREGTVKLDAEALRQLIRQLGGANLELVVERIGTDKLKPAQISALKDNEVLAAYDIYLRANGQRIPDLGGGTARITVRHQLASGQKPAGLVVLYVAEDGAKTTLPFSLEGDSAVAFTVTHFSNYVITYDDARANGGVSSCPKDKTCPIEPFVDTENTAWWHDGIHYCIANGLMNGIASDQFAPDATTTRAMIVTILWRIEGSPMTDYAMSFADVSQGSWYTEAIRWAQSVGVVLGYSETAFGPEDFVTREQLAAILYRYAAHCGVDVTARNSLTQYLDAGEISAWALDNLMWANAVGMVMGRSATQLAPQDDATRAEAASMIQRFCEKILHK